jgi:glycosyltransferase involved in cell wall biosynthesis
MIKVIHIAPSEHGLRVYADLINKIYAQEGVDVTPLFVTERINAEQVASELAKNSRVIFHFEIGSGDASVFKLSRLLLRKSKAPQIVTIHDPGVVVAHPFGIPGTGSKLSLVRNGAKVLRKLTSLTLGRLVIDQYLKNDRLHRIYLRPDLASGSQSYYLPHPTFHEHKPEPPKPQAGRIRIGFGGFWGRGKGIETLVAAAAMARSQGSRFDLVVAGGSSQAGSGYEAELKRLAKAVYPEVDLPGVLDDDQLTGFIQGLSVLVLPYWPELPNGTSGMAMWAGELAVPVIASDTLALKEQLGEGGASYVTPKDASALAEAMKQLMDHPEQYRELARRTQDEIFKKNSWVAVGEKLSKIVKLLEERSSH